MRAFDLHFRKTERSTVHKPWTALLRDNESVRTIGERIKKNNLNQKHAADWENNSILVFYSIWKITMITSLLLDGYRNVMDGIGTRCSTGTENHSLRLLAGKETITWCSSWAINGLHNRRFRNGKKRRKRRHAVGANVLRKISFTTNKKARKTFECLPQTVFYLHGIIFFCTGIVTTTALSFLFYKSLRFLTELLQLLQVTQFCLRTHNNPTSYALRYLIFQKKAK